MADESTGSGSAPPHRSEAGARAGLRRFYDALFEHSPDAIYLHDLEGRFLDANPAALSLLGYGRDEIRMLRLEDLLTSDRDLAAVRATMAHMLSTGDPGEPTRYRIRRKDGGLVWVEVVATIAEEAGRPVAVQGIARDLGERVRAEEILRFQARILGGIEQAVIATDPDGRIVYCNRFAEGLYGWSAAEMLGRSVVDVTVPRPSREQAEEILARLAAGRSWSGELEVQRRDGTRFPAAVNDAPVLDDDGRLVAIVGLSRDISEHKRAERERRRSEQQYRDLVELTHDLVWAVDLEGRITFMSEASRRIYGRAPEDMVGRRFLEFAPPEEVERLNAQLDSTVATGEATTAFECRMLHREGHEVILRANAVPVRDEAGVLQGFVGTSQDVTERRQAEAARRQVSDLLNATFQSMVDAVFVVDARTRTIRSCNEAVRGMFGFAPDELVGQSTEVLHVDREHHRRFGELSEPVLTRDGIFRGEFRMRRRDGTDFATENTVTAIREDLGWGAGVVSVVRDLSERRHAEAMARLQGAALEAAADAIVITDRDGSIEWVNRAFTTLTGYEASEAIGKNPRELLKSGAHGPELYEQLWSTILAGGVWRGEMTNRRKDGSLYPEELTVTPVRDAGGEIRHFVGIKRDLSELKRIEAQYLQAQKMETVGRLAGGIAHDFNNLLTVINGTAELLAREVPAGGSLQRELNEIHQAGERAARLTRQLLAVSRRQILQPVPLDLSALARDWRGMLQRLVGERIDVVIDAPIGEGTVSADPGQIEQVVMNLVVNARDAMPEGGTLTIAVRGVEVAETGGEPEGDGMPAGRYVVLGVHDTGIGIDETTREQMFEPFFTTKGPEGGSGLGLATVHGIVVQSGGLIRVESEHGRGTGFEIYLPRTEPPTEPVRDALPASARSSSASGRGGETVLVVEDEGALRLLAERILRSAGYEVLLAESGSAALDLLEGFAGRIDLLLTDMVLPGMTGLELAARIAELRPGVRILLTSGYTDDAQMRDDVGGRRTAFLAKPFTASDLRRKVREVLDATAPGA